MVETVAQVADHWLCHFPPNSLETREVMTKEPVSHVHTLAIIVEDFPGFNAVHAEVTDGFFSQ